MEGARFDVFLSYNRADEAVVEHVAGRLREGAQAWLDRWALTRGGRWQEEIVAGLGASGACAVFVGAHGLGDWAREELAVAQDRAAKDRGFRLFMVLLPGAIRPDDPSLAFLATRTWVDLRAGIHDVGDLLAAVNGDCAPAAGVSATGDDVCPYRGLEVFEPNHAELFFGRDHDTVRAVEKLRYSRFLAVLGPSGCGKSSLVRAGAVPALSQGALPGGASWTVRLITPGARPVSVLAAQLAALSPGESMQRTVDGLRADERTLDLAVSLALADRSGCTVCGAARLSVLMGMRNTKRITVTLPKQVVDQVRATVETDAAETVPGYVADVLVERFRDENIDLLQTWKTSAGR